MRVSVGWGGIGMGGLSGPLQNVLTRAFVEISADSLLGRNH